MATAMLIAEPTQGQITSILPNLQLNWPSIEGCPSTDDMRQAIARHLGEATGHTNAVAATAMIEHTTGYHLVLYTRSGAGVGTRELTGDDCRGVADAAVVILAIMLGTESVTPADAARGVEGESVPQRRRAPLPKVEPLAPPSRVVLTPRDLRLRATSSFGSIAPRVGVGAWVPIGTMKTPRLGVIANAMVEFSGWRLIPQVGWAPEQKVGMVANGDRGAWVTLISFGLSAGPAFKYGRWEWVPRIGICEQILRAKGFGVDVPLPHLVYFGSARFGTLLQLRLMSRVYVQSMLDLSVPFSRPAILLDPGGEVLRPARLGLDAGLLLALRF